MAARTTEWSTVHDLLRRLEHRWTLGAWLSPYALGEPFDPVAVPVRTPTATDLIERTGDVQAWIERFRSDAARRPHVRVSDKTLQSRAVGSNDVPATLHLDSFDDLVDSLGVRSDVDAFDHTLSLTESSVPEATDWVRRHPLKVVPAATIWAQVIAAVRWVIDTDVSQLDLRHIDANGVDSKFLIEHRSLIRPLLDAVLDPDRVNTESNDLDKRYGFRSRPTHVRLRTLGNDIAVIDSTLTEIEVRVDELAELPLAVTNVFVVENRATFNAFPDLLDSVVVFGGGYAVSSLGPIDWLHERSLVYWGDIDTHGYRILSRLRQLFPHCESMLMDAETLKANLDRVVQEPSPLTEHLEHLTEAEKRLYNDLREDRYGPAVRLEQERISMGSLGAQLDTFRHG